MQSGPTRRLNSWKEIAQYLGHDVTTAIRWEKIRGLPVRRVPGGKRQAVFAYTHEIDSWLVGETVDISESEKSPGATVGNRPIRWALWAAGLVVVFFVFLLLTSARVEQSIQPPDTPFRISFADNKIWAWSDQGTLRWSYEFAQPLRALSWTVMKEPLWSATYYVEEDLDDDGAIEVLVSVPMRGSNDELYCFSPAGEPLWSVTLDDEIEFGGGRFGPPWSEGLVTTYRINGETRIAWSQNHHTWWPSIVSVLTTRGERLGKFVHSGSIRALTRVQTSTGPLLLGGGTSNARNAAMLFVLDGGNITGTSPEEPGSFYECRNCLPGLPLHYFIFPRSEINLVGGTSPYNLVEGIVVFESGIEVRTREYTHDTQPGGIFHFSLEFALEQAMMSDGYWLLHTIWEKEGRIDHSLEHSPERLRPPPVRMWNAENGWSLLVPAYTEQISGVSR